MRIKDVEQLVGITKKNIRFYEEAGLLTPGRNAENSYREYDMEDVDRLLRIKLLRRLDMPVSEIRSLLDGSITLSVAARRHDLYLEGRMESVSRARAVCASLSGDIAELDASAVLAEMERMEKEGVRFVDVEKRDVRKKYTGPAVACGVIVLLMAALMVFFVWMYRRWSMPLGILIFFLVVYAGVAFGTVAAFVSRIREIRGGEENDLGNY